MQYFQHIFWDMMKSAKVNNKITYLNLKSLQLLAFNSYFLWHNRESIS